MAALNLRHVFPEIGKVEVPLHNESKELLMILNGKNGYFFKRLEKIDHLGELKSVIHCGHHSRYEYLLLQLYLIHFFKQEAKVFGLGSKVDLGNGIKISSGEELLKCWSILCENGHLYGTFEMERFWLSIISQIPDMKNLFLQAFSDSRIERIARDIISEENDLEFYRLLSWIFIERTLKKINNEGQKYTFEILKEILHTLLAEHDEGSPIFRYIRGFSRIRRISFLFLDLQRLPVQMKFSAPILLEDIREHPETYLYDDEIVLSKFLDSINQLLLDKIYCSVDATAFKAEHLKICTNVFKIRQKQVKISRYGKKRYPNKIGNSDRLVQALDQARRNVPYTNVAINTAHLKHYIRLYFKPDEPFDIIQCKIYSYKANFEKAVKSDHWQIFLSPFSNEEGPGYFLDIFEDINIPEKNEGLVIGELIRIISKTYEDFSHIKEIYLWLIEDHLRDVFDAILTRYLPREISTRWIEANSQSESKASILFSKTERSKWSRSIAWEVKNKKITPDRTWESECLRREVRNSKRGILIISNCNLILEDKNHKSLAELDGAFIRIYRGTVELTIVEAKSGRSGGSASAKNQLEETLRKFGASKYQSIALTHRKNKYSVATIPLSIARKWPL